MPDGRQVEIGGYDGLTPLGRDGFAETYRAQRTVGEGEVVLTVLSAELATAEVRRALNRHWLSSQRLNDQEHLQQVVDAGATPGGRPYVATEFCAAGSLGDRLTARGSLTFGGVVAAAVPIALTLYAIHESGQSYGTVVPDAILIRDDGQPMLADLPTAALRAQHAARPPHAAPELSAGEEPSPASDVYSLAATIVHLLTGRPPAQSVPTLRPEDAPTPLRRAIAAALHADPDARPDALVFAQHLRDVLVEQGLPEPAVDWPQRPTRRTRRRTQLTPSNPAPLVPPAPPDQPVETSGPPTAVASATALPASPNPPAVAGPPPPAPVPPPSPAVAPAATTASAPASTVAGPLATTAGPPAAQNRGGPAHRMGWMGPASTQAAAEQTKPVEESEAAARELTVAVVEATAGSAAAPAARRWAVPVAAVGILAAAVLGVAAVNGLRGSAADVTPQQPAVAQPPTLTAPTSVSVAGDGSTASIRWQLPPGMESNHVVVQLVPTPADGPPIVVLDAGQTSYSVARLDPGSAYCFRVGIAAAPVGRAPTVAWAEPVGLRGTCSVAG